MTGWQNRGSRFAGPDIKWHSGQELFGCIGYCAQVGWWPQYKKEIQKDAQDVQVWLWLQSRPNVQICSCLITCSFVLFWHAFASVKLQVDRYRDMCMIEVKSVMTHCVYLSTSTFTLDLLLAKFIFIFIFIFILLVLRNGASSIYVEHSCKLERRL